MTMIPTPKYSPELDKLIFLLHRDGTTDITRTVHWGTPSAFQKVSKCWTQISPTHPHSRDTQAVILPRALSFTEAKTEAQRG